MARIVLGKVGMTPGGEYNGSTTYEKLTIVSRGGSSYLSITQVSDIEPGLAFDWEAYWMLLSEKGNDGLGNNWYTGEGIYGTSLLPEIFLDSGVENAVIGDLFLNTSAEDPSAGNVYRCTVEGTSERAKWVFSTSLRKDSNIFIRWSDAEPTQDSDILSEPSEWVGIYAGESATAPTDYTDYQWYHWKGEPGSTGENGEKGSTGERGERGETGAQGEPGEAATFSISETITGNPGTYASIVETPSSTAAEREYVLTVPRGETGATGDAGEKGETGEQGPRGETGNTGAKGETGATGKDGAGITFQGVVSSYEDLQDVAGELTEEDRGIAWYNEDDSLLYIWDGEGFPPEGSGTPIRGPKGETGAQGGTGEQGPVGATGATGATGPAGITGETGLPGEQGEKGDKGDTGAKGETGAKGDTGEVGQVGATGADGATGEAGPAGNTGAKGDKGETGEKGDTGATGETGATGPAGATGSKGDDGATGATGEQGLQGEPGPNLPINDVEPDTDGYEIVLQNIPMEADSFEAGNILVPDADGILADSGVNISKLIRTSEGEGISSTTIDADKLNGLTSDQIIEASLFPRLRWNSDVLEITYNGETWGSVPLI